ncbi:glycosyltransferase family 4 protein [Xenorhabdus nematophila]|uniref:glycosyltransferase family 4 protein n=1 Tax=Xenorhabdus nematophila TaxID=628 RepID=UPI000543323C|nr:glycosyltransferase family 4 protein [Xenorhabdus nematophila]CEE92622.1 WalN protein [Xenorhabdus nematophila str. Anatoliense]CEF32948.1 WalN protein [Xenorhabdus nematophila str. Websteri]AYA42531.1 glycosyltransferase family 1 protein [Xenorhabdus nematophila]KHD28678.1 WalN protein [Xenorhabdus nematophila]MBA0020275.1 glycosyltransferase family 4 protein [Xenorhabdus nematophila]
MKIGFIDVTVTMSYGGIQTAVWELAKALTDAGHEIHIFGGTGDIRPELAGRNIHIHTFPFIPRERVLNIGRRFQRIVERYSFARHAREAVMAENFDWLILTKPFDFFWPRMIPKTSHTKFCYMSGGTSFFKGDRILGKKISAWVACSHFNAWQIQHHFKQFPSVIYNGVDTDKFKPIDSDIRIRLGINEDTFLLTFAGRLVGWKGMKVAIEAMTLLRDKDVKLLIIGAGEELKQLEKRVSALKLKESVIFHPPVSHDQLPKFYAAGDAGLFPSIGDEAFGITIAEAMACGRPVIASYIGGIPEVVGNENQAGILVTPGDAPAIAASVNHLLSLEDRGKGMGKCARQRIEAMYTWEHSANRLLNAIKK